MALPMTTSPKDINPPDPSSARLIAHIDLAAIARNWTILNGLNPKAKAGAVVKADAYGHGMNPVAKTLAEAGCETFFVASIEEAIELRKTLPHHRIGYFDGLHPSHESAVINLGMMPAINTPAQLSLLAKIAGKANKPIPAMLQFDIGMNRIGAGEDSAQNMLNSADLKAGDWNLVFSHLSTSDDPANPANEQQRQRFEDLIAKAPPALRSLSASGGIGLGEEFHYDITRPGLAIYGLSPHSTSPALPYAEKLTPALSLSALVLQIRNAKAGESVGYGGSATLKRDSRLATIAGGYGDGINRKLWSESAKNHAAIVEKNGFIAPMIGRISMDVHVVDITDWPKNSVKEGDHVMLIGQAQSASDLAHKSDTISYEVLTTLGLRASRVYANDVKT